MRTAFFALGIVCALLAAIQNGLALAQCDSGFCRPQPAPQAPAATVPNLAVCRVIAGSGASRSMGTGTAISSNRAQTAILTARHVVDRVGTPVIAVFANGQQLSGQAAVVCLEADAAIVVVNGAPPGLARIAPEVPPPQSTIWFGGFDGSAGWRHQAGRLVRQTSSGDWVITGPSRGGDSGGPAWTEEGIVGVVWGTDGKETLCTSLPQLVNFFQSSRYVFPWNAWLNDRKDARDHGQVLPPQPMPRAPVPQPAPPTAPSVQSFSSDLLHRLASLESKIAAIEAKTSQLDNRLAELAAHNGSAAAKAESAAGVAAEAKRHAEEMSHSLAERVRDTLIGWLPVHLGVPTLVVVIIGGVVFWLIRRDVKNRMETGDPLEVEKLLQRAAEKTPMKIDDWLVGLLSKALDRVMPRPTTSKKGTPR